MTEQSEKKREGMNRGQLLFCIMGTVSLVIAFIYSEDAIEAMSSGMRLCVNTVIPSLFPFMVVSEIFVASGGASFIGKVLSPVLGRVFRISGEGCVAYLLGMLCGFPVGIKSAISLYKRGIIDRHELEHLCTFCNGPSSAFLISAVGSSLFGSKKFGLLLYAAHIITCALIGFASSFYFSSKRNVKRAERFVISESTKGGGIAKSVVDAVTRSASGVLYVCAFVVFFSALTPPLSALCEKLALPPILRALLIGFFEMTGGAFSVTSLPVSLAVLAVAAITFWSGLSVLFQLVGLVGECEISLTPYVIAKAVGALVCPAVLVLLLRLFGEDCLLTMSVNGDSISSFLQLNTSPLSSVSLALFALSSLLLKKKIYSASLRASLLRKRCGRRKQHKGYK